MWSSSYGCCLIYIHEKNFGCCARWCRVVGANWRNYVSMLIAQSYSWWTWFNWRRCRLHYYARSSRLQGQSAFSKHVETLSITSLCLCRKWPGHGRWIWIWVCQSNLHCSQELCCERSRWYDGSWRGPRKNSFSSDTPLHPPMSVSEPPISWWFLRWNRRGQPYDCNVWKYAG